MKRSHFRFCLLAFFVVSLPLAGSLAGCDAEDDENYADGSLCAAATRADDDCEDAFGEQATECTAFDDIDEGCERGDVGDADRCPTAVTLLVSCSALFGDDADQCDALQTIADSCDDA